MSKRREITPAEFNALLRSDLYTFIVRSFLELYPESEFHHNWHIEKIAEELEKCARGENHCLNTVVVNQVCEEVTRGEGESL